jgi:hypothetical protein
MEENCSPIQNESTKETKGFVTRISHKIQKTIGLTSSNKPDILLDNQVSSQIKLKSESQFPTTITILDNQFLDNDPTQIFEPKMNKLIRSEKKFNLFEEEEEKEKEEISCKKDKKDTDSDSSDTDPCTEVRFREVQIVQLTGCHGPTGPPGPPGPASPYLNALIYLTRDTEQQLATEEAIQWTLQPIKVGDIDNITNTSDIFIWKAGFYSVCYNVCSQQPCNFALVKNGDIVSGSTINAISGFTQNSVLLIMCINKSDLSFPTSISPTGFAAKIKIVNYTATTPHVRLIRLNDRDTFPQMVATISISLLSEM